MKPIWLQTCKPLTCAFLMLGLHGTFVTSSCGIRFSGAESSLFIGLILSITYMEMLKDFLLNLCKSGPVNGPLSRRIRQNTQEH